MCLGTVVAYFIIINNNNNDNNSIIITIIHVTRRSRRATHRARKIVFSRYIILYTIFYYYILFWYTRDWCLFTCVCVWWWCDLPTSKCVSFKRYCADKKSSSVVFHDDANALFDSAFFIIAACAALLYDIT